MKKQLVVEMKLEDGREIRIWTCVKERSAFWQAGVVMDNEETSETTTWYNIFAFSPEQAHKKMAEAIEIDTKDGGLVVNVNTEEF